MQNVQELKPNELLARRNYGKWPQNGMITALVFTRKFYLNCRIGSDDISQVIAETPLRSQKVAVWYALKAEGFIGYCFNKNIDML